MRINWFLMSAAALNLAGAIWFLVHSSPKLAVVGLAYSVATAVLATMEG